MADPAWIWTGSGYRAALLRHRSAGLTLLIQWTDASDSWAVTRWAWSMKACWGRPSMANGRTVGPIEGVVAQLRMEPVPLDERKRGGCDAFIEHLRSLREAA